MPTWRVRSLNLSSRRSIQLSATDSSCPALAASSRRGISRHPTSETKASPTTATPSPTGAKSNIANASPEASWRRVAITMLGGVPTRAARQAGGTSGSDRVARYGVTLTSPSSPSTFCPLTARTTLSLRAWIRAPSSRAVRRGQLARAVPTANDATADRPASLQPLTGGQGRGSALRALESGRSQNSYPGGHDGDQGGSAIRGEHPAGRRACAARRPEGRRGPCAHRRLGRVPLGLPRDEGRVDAAAAHGARPRSRGRR